MAETLSFKPFDAVRSEWEPAADVWYAHLGVEVSDMNAIHNRLSHFVRMTDPYDRILELAAGANNAPYYPDDFDMMRVTAVDGSRTALDRNPSGVRLLADIRRPLHYQNGTFGLSVCIFGMRYIENQEVVIHELIRLTKPAGWIVLFDYNEGDRRMVRPFDSAYLAAFAQTVPGVGETATECFAQIYDEWTLDMLAIQRSADPTDSL